MFETRDPGIFRDWDSQINKGTMSPRHPNICGHYYIMREISVQVSGHNIYFQIIQSVNFGTFEYSRNIGQKSLLSCTVIL